MMSLLRNNRADGGGPLTFLGGGAAFTTTRLASSPGDLLGWYSRHEVYSGIPDGTRPHESFLSPLDAGGLAADIYASASLTGQIVGEEIGRAHV
jgi:hypothetical protein